MGATDANHNAKSARYQIIAAGGTEGASLGRHVLDTYLLRLAKISVSMYRPDDFASDRLLLDLVSFQTINKIAVVDDCSVSAEDQGALALVFLAVRMSVYAVNGKGIPASHRAVYIWSAVILLTSMSGVAVITKKNLISEAVPFVFIVLQADVTKPGLATSESAEHIFGMCRTIIREFTTMEFTQIIEKLTPRLSLMFSSDLKSSRDPQKDYLWGDLCQF